MNGLTYDKDIRHTEPNVNPNRQARFKVGWRRAAEEDYIYGGQTLELLTWENLGNRLGAILKNAPEELQEEMYDLCVRIQEWQHQNNSETNEPSADGE